MHFLATLLLSLALGLTYTSHYALADNHLAITRKSLHLPSRPPTHLAIQLGRNMLNTKERLSLNILSNSCSLDP